MGKNLRGARLLSWVRVTPPPALPSSVNPSWGLTLCISTSLPRDADGARPHGEPLFEKESHALNPGARVCACLQRRELTHGKGVNKGASHASAWGSLILRCSWRLCISGLLLMLGWLVPALPGWPEGRIHTK